ncbi:hypothetical protein ACS0TY_020684 [Phlomoides rotata]
MSPPPPPPPSFLPNQRRRMDLESKYWEWQQRRGGVDMVVAVSNEEKRMMFWDGVDI